MKPPILLLAAIFSSAVFAQSPQGDGVSNAVLSSEGERVRIRAERDQLDRVFSIEEQACYQRFAVNDCIGSARTVRREGMADLRRQELSISAVDARQKGADQLSRSEMRTSEQAMREAEKRLLDAQSGQRERLNAIDERAAARARSSQQVSDRARELQQRVDARDQAQKERAEVARMAAERRDAFELKQRESQKRLAGRKNEIKRSAAPASQ